MTSSTRPRRATWTRRSCRQRPSVGGHRAPPRTRVAVSPQGRSPPVPGEEDPTVLSATAGARPRGPNAEGRRSRGRGPRGGLGDEHAIEVVRVEGRKGSPCGGVHSGDCQHLEALAHSASRRPSGASRRPAARWISISHTVAAETSTSCSGCAIASLVAASSVGSSSSSGWMRTSGRTAPRGGSGRLQACPRAGMLGGASPGQRVEGHTGCGAAWLARLTGGQEVAGSNPASPTRKGQVRGSQWPGDPVAPLRWSPK